MNSSYCTFFMAVVHCLCNLLVLYVYLQIRLDQTKKEFNLSFEDMKMFDSESKKFEKYISKISDLTTTTTTHTTTTTTTTTDNGQILIRKAHLSLRLRLAKSNSKEYSANSIILQMLNTSRCSGENLRRPSPTPFETIYLN